MDAWGVWHVANDLIGFGCVPDANTCSETAVEAEPFIGPKPAKVKIPVEGTIEFDGDDVTQLTLVQSRPVSLPVATSFDRGGNIMIEGLAWELIDGNLAQVSNASVKCDSSAGPGCRAHAKRLSSPGTEDSPFDFDGIPLNFPIQLGALVLNEHAPIVVTRNGKKDISVAVASHSPSTAKAGPLFNAATVAHFNLKTTKANKK